MSCFINFSNHPSSRWGEEQLAAAQKHGEVQDYAFPSVDPKATTEQVNALAQECAEHILSLNPSAVLCQGEFSLAMETARILKERSVMVLVACSERKVVEDYVDGKTVKNAVFEFVQFRTV